MAGKPQSGGASPTEPPLGLGQTVVAGLAEGLLDIGVVKVCGHKMHIVVSCMCVVWRMLCLNLNICQNSRL